MAGGRGVFVVFLLHHTLFTEIYWEAHYFFSGLLILNQLTQVLWCYTLFWISLFTTILYYFLQYQQAEHSVFSQSFLWFIMSINWPDASFLQMIAGVHLNIGFSLSALSLKSQSVFNGNNRSFHMLISKLNLMIT